MYIWHTTNTTDPNMINDDNGIDRTINHSNDDNPDNNHNHHRHHQQHHNRNMNSTGSQRWWLSFATFVLHFRALFCICGLCLVRGIGALLNRLLSLSNICMCPRPNLSNIHSPPSPPDPRVAAAVSHCGSCGPSGPPPRPRGRLQALRRRTAPVHAYILLLHNFVMTLPTWLSISGRTGK